MEHAVDRKPDVNEKLFPWYKKFEERCLDRFDCEKSLYYDVFNAEEEDSKLTIKTCQTVPKPQLQHLIVHPDLAAVEVTLRDDQCLWSAFASLDHEMIVTPAGRGLHPKLAINIRNMNPTGKYYVLVEIMPVDDNKYTYKYDGSGWVRSGKADPPFPERKHYHPSAPVNKPASGHFWMKDKVEFSKLKLTNSTEPKSTSAAYLPIIVHSMQRYQPRITIIVVPDASLYNQHYQLFRHFSFQETQFIAVTAYCTEAVRELKINTNNYATGFRNQQRILKDVFVKANTSNAIGEKVKKERSAEESRCYGYHHDIDHTGLPPLPYSEDVGVTMQPLNTTVTMYEMSLQPSSPPTHTNQSTVSCMSSTAPFCDQYCMYNDGYGNAYPPPEQYITAETRVYQPAGPYTNYITHISSM